MTRLSASTFVALALLAPLAALAEGPASLATAEEASAKLGKGQPILVVFTTDGSDHDKAAKTAWGDKRLAKAIEGGAVIARVDPKDEASANKLNISAEKTECTVALDGYGVACGKHEKAPNVDAFNKLLKTAQDTTAKKKKVEKNIETAATRADAALKKDDTATACQQIAPTLEFEKTVPCEAMTRAKRIHDDLVSKADALLAKARAATGASNFAEARKHIAEANAKFPLPSVEADAKKARDECAQAEAQKNQQR
ncbi:MAG: hypothetical protein ACAI25_18630 [Planctomycetota bacterium]